ncbi:MAG: exodeoxyribonuclease VII large subunit [Saprospiraceae bacterium]
METHSLFELNEYIRRVVALNFREPIWIKAEANQINKSRNNFYFDLVEKEKGKDNIIAKASGVLWAKNYFFLKKKLGDVLDQILMDGTEILIKVKVDFNERYGFKLQIEDIDPAYTFGQTEIRRQEIIEQIKKNGLLKLNLQHLLPKVIKRIAVLSSETAAGYQDFKQQLVHNSYGYRFDIKLYSIPVQGALLESKLLHTIDEINANSARYDALVIVRGGGSRLDLSWFDTYKIAEKIAHASLPVFTGIGHDIDTSIADMVAHTSIKTPTAAADFLIEYNTRFEAEVIDICNQILAYSQDRILEANMNIERLSTHITSLASQTFTAQQILLDNNYRNILSLVEVKIKNELKDLVSKELLVQNLEPMNVINRGYAVVYKGKKSIHSTKELKKGDQFSVHMADGKMLAKKIDL